MRVTALILFSIAVSGAGVAVAQSERAARNGAETSPRPETPDEVIVRGQRLGELRLEIQAARERAYDIFNEINSTNDFDVHCRDETRTFSHATQRVCRAQFENRISTDAGRQYLSSLIMRCPGDAGITQGCVFSAIGQTAADQGRALGGQIPGRRAQMNQEILRLANENPQFAQAILDYYKASQEYEAARKSRDGD